MRVLLVSLLVLLAAAGLVWFAAHQPGYVLLALGHYSVELSAVAAGVLLAMLILAVYVLIRVLVRFNRLPVEVGRLRDQQKRRRARKDLEQGLIALAQADWPRAEKTLSHSAQYSESPLINYLAAARAAQMMGQPSQRDERLRRAHEIAPQADIAVGLTQAELQLASGETEQALASLQRLRELDPRHGYVLKQLAKAYFRLRDWQGLYQVLPALRKANAVTANEFKRLEHAACLGLMQQSASERDADALSRLWKGFSNELRTDESALLAYARHSVALDQPEQAADMIRDALDDSWSERLAMEYGRIEGADPEQQLTHGEAWLKRHPQSAMLLLSLARICNRAKLWGKARLYFESSIGLQPLPESFRDLAELVEQRGDENTAQECYRKGLKLAVDGVAEPLRTRKQKYAEKNREPAEELLISRRKTFPA